MKREGGAFQNVFVIHQKISLTADSEEHHESMIHGTIPATQQLPLNLSNQKEL
jgi:hypothetical protein